MEEKKLPQNISKPWVFHIDPINRWAYWNDAFTPEECQKIIDYANKFEKIDGTISQDKNVDLAVRESKVVWLSPDEETFWVFDRLTSIVDKLNNDYFGFDIFGMIEGLQFTEYNGPTGHYEKHVDCLYGDTVRKLSFSVQLSNSGDYDNGNLILHYKEKPEPMVRNQGTLVMFPSYTLHEVTPITEGRRCSLVGWVTGKPFK